MKLRLKEDPKEWRKATWLSALGLGMLNTLLCWRRILPVAGWLAVLAALAGAALLALIWPRWFRGYYRFSARFGFCVSRLAGHAFLCFFFLLLLVPLGLVLRLLGKDALRLRHSQNEPTYWVPAKEPGPLERLF